MENEDKNLIIKFKEFKPYLDTVKSNKILSDEDKRKTTVAFFKQLFGEQFNEGTILYLAPVVEKILFDEKLNAEIGYDGVDLITDYLLLSIGKTVRRRMTITDGRTRTVVFPLMSGEVRKSNRDKGIKRTFTKS